MIPLARGVRPWTRKAGRPPAGKAHQHGLRQGFVKSVIPEHPGAQPIPLPQNPQQDVLRPYVAVPQLRRGLLRFLDGVLARSVNRSFMVCSFPGFAPGASFPLLYPPPCTNPVGTGSWGAPLAILPAEARYQPNLARPGSFSVKKMPSHRFSG